MNRQAPPAVEADFHERMHATHMYGLWELASQMTRHPEPKAIPYLWKSSVIEAMVRESGEVVPVGEERRALQLFNPGMDGLDIPLVQALNAMFFQMYEVPQVPLTKPNNASAALFGHVSLSPTWVKERPRSSPLLLYSWETTRKSLEALGDAEGDEAVTSTFGA